MQLWQEARKKGKALRAKHKKAEEAQRQKLYTDITNPKKKKGTTSAKDTPIEEQNPLFSPLGLELRDSLPKEPQVVVDQWVAVAYQDNWYPGRVIEMKPNKDMRVDFAARTANCIRFKSPNGKDVQWVEKQFLISDNCKPHPVSGGRFWEFLESGNIDHTFQLFKQIYF